MEDDHVQTSRLRKSGCPTPSLFDAYDLVQLANWANQTLDSLRLNLADYLSEESRNLVGRREADARFAELDRLKLALERIDARFERIAQRHDKPTA
jgi:ubiquinone biosynthesis protein UbiJ